MKENSTGSKIKSLRSNHNLTQKQLADMVGVSNKAISKWESDEGLPDIDNLKRVSSIFNISIDELVSNEPRERKISSWVVVMLLTLGLTVVLYFLPFLKFNPFGETNFAFLTITGFQLLKTGFINFQIGKLIVGLCLSIILINSLVHFYCIYKNIELTVQKLLALASAVSSVLALSTIYILIKTPNVYMDITSMPNTYMEITLVPIVLILLQVLQFVIYVKYQKKITSIV